MSAAIGALAFQNVLYEKKGAVAYATLNRPKVLNALNQATVAGLKAAFEDAADDRREGGGILTAAAASAVAAGGECQDHSNATPLETAGEATSWKKPTSRTRNL